MSIDKAGTPQVVSPGCDLGSKLDRRRLVQGALAASLAGAAGGLDARMAARAAGATGHSGTLPQSVAPQSSPGGVTAGACLEASLHVMMQ
jgi:hypothetical protein